MERWTFRNRIRLILAALIALGLLLSPVGRSASHDAALAAGLTFGTGDHGHFHDEFGDDVADDDHRSGHSHGHNPSDHSHQTFFVPASFALALPVTSRGWLALFDSLVAPKVMIRLDRPPRGVVAA